MKKQFSGVLVILLFLGVVTIGESGAQATPLTLSITLVLNSSKYLLIDPGDDPITAEITIRNTGTSRIITAAGFSNRPFHLFLIFIGPDGKQIRAREVGTGEHEGPPPRIIFDNGVPVQVEEVEILDVGFEKIITIPDVRVFYELDKAGRYTVKEVVSIVTYPPPIDFTNAAGQNFERIDSSDFAGVIESNTVRFSLNADADTDGYSFPEDDRRIATGLPPLPDCDDSRGDVNPGAPEIAGDGLDNDCNPATIDNIVGVKIDIEPHDAENKIRLGTGKPIPVVIFSSPTFDATKVDPKTVTLESAPVRLKGNGAPMVSFRDFNKDGRLDLLVRIQIRDAADLTVGDTEAVLEGKTVAIPGRPFFNIRGVDKVKVIP